MPKTSPSAEQILKAEQKTLIFGVLEREKQHSQNIAPPEDTSTDEALDKEIRESGVGFPCTIL